MDLEQYNSDVQGWTTEAVSAMKAAGAGMGITHRSNSPSKGASLPKVKGRLTFEMGAASKVSIRFPRQLIYTHKGAGKGRGGSKGSRWIDQYGNSKKTNPKSFGKMGTAGRSSKPFINETLDGEHGVEKLADIAAAALGSTIINNVLIK